MADFNHFSVFSPPLTHLGTVFFPQCGNESLHRLVFNWDFIDVQIHIISQSQLLQLLQTQGKKSRMVRHGILGYSGYSSGFLAHTLHCLEERVSWELRQKKQQTEQEGKKKTHNREQERCLSTCVNSLPRQARLFCSDVCITKKTTFNRQQLSTKKPTFNWQQSSAAPTLKRKVG